MAEKQRKGQLSGGIYISLAVCIFLIVSIGIYSSLNSLFLGDVEKELKYDAAPKVNENRLVPDKLLSLDPLFDAGLSSLKDKEERNIVQSNTTGTVKKEEEYIKKTYVKPTAGEIQKEFSGDVLVYSGTMNDYRVHSGIDYHGDIGDAVVSFGDGKIETIYHDPLMGWTVVVNHDDGLYSSYANLSDIIPEGIEAGAKVNAGSIIGSIGTSSLIEIGEEPHLHFEVIRNGIKENPQEYLS